MMGRKEELEQLSSLEILELMEQYGIEANCGRPVAIARIMEFEAKAHKKTRPPRNAANTRLKAMRIKMGMTQSELASAANINMRVLQHYEQGTKPFDSARLDVILKICIALNCEMSDILDNKENIALYNQYCKDIK